MATETDLDLAVSAANTAFKAWSKLNHDQRSKLLIRFTDELEAHKDGFTELLHRETGKPVCDPLAIRLPRGSLMLISILVTIC